MIYYIGGIIMANLKVSIVNSTTLRLEEDGKKEIPLILKCSIC